jgi:hypothetical protein
MKDNLLSKDRAKAQYVEATATKTLAQLDFKFVSPLGFVFYAADVFVCRDGQMLYLRSTKKTTTPTVTSKDTKDTKEEGEFKVTSR